MSLAVYGVDAPRRAAAVAGVLGLDASLAKRLAEAVDADLHEVHSDRSSTLYLDRDPLRWSGRWRSSGLAWSEGIFRTDRVRTWQQAARDLGACGLVINGRRRLVHSSVAGELPLYWMDLGESICFSTRIDALARIAPGKLTIDWESWSGTFTLGFPVGDRTPFREIRRLRPFSTLELRDGGASIEREEWPWAAVEPDLTRQEGQEAVLEAMRGAVEPMAAGEVLCALSGGYDSRLILSLLLDRGAERIRAFTVNNDVGRETEERLAAAVAAEAGVPHETVVGTAAGYWGELAERYRRSEYQRPSNAWLVTLANRMGRESGLATDGLGLGALMGIQGGLITEEMIGAGNGAGGKVARALWRTHSANETHRGLIAACHHAMSSSAKKQFLEETRWLRGHPAQASLSRYWTSTVRGYSLAPATALGEELRVATPFVVDRVATALLRVKPRDKFDGSFYRDLLNAVNPKLAAMPSTHEVAAGERTTTQRRTDPAVITQYERALESSPLRPVYAPRVENKLREGRTEVMVSHQRPHWRTVAIVMFSLWHERYADILRPYDPRDLIA